jgi:putative flippase GtrA
VASKRQFLIHLPALAFVCFGAISSVLKFSTYPIAESENGWWRVEVALFMAAAVCAIVAFVYQCLAWNKSASRIDQNFDSNSPPE